MRAAGLLLSVLVLTTVGTEVSWGATVNGIAIGGLESCAQTPPQKIKCWGAAGGESSSHHLITSDFAVPKIEGAAQVSVGWDHACALVPLSSSSRPPGTVWCWGDNDFGQLGVGNRFSGDSPQQVEGISAVIQIVSGDKFSCALFAGGATRCWGLNDHGQLGKPGGGWWEFPLSPTQLGTVKQLSAGGARVCALMNDGTVKCWGKATSVPASDGSTTDSVTPVAVRGLAGVKSVTVGGTHVCALLADNSIRCWGDNRVGQLGDGTQTARPSPVKPLVLGVVEEVSAGDEFTCARLRDSTVSCWGRNDDGQLGRPAGTAQPNPATIEGLRGVAQIDAGGRHACVLLNGGLADRKTVKCFGDDHFAQLGDGPGSGNTGSLRLVGHLLDPVLASGSLGPMTGLLDAMSSNATDARINIGRVPDALIACILDGQQIVNCQTPLFLNAMTEDSHSLTVTQTDPAGNTSPPATFRWTIDRTPPPAPVITSSPTGLIADSAPKFVFTGEYHAKFRCMIDGRTADCASPLQLRGVPDGDHTLSIRQLDAAGNSSPITTTRWSSDTRAPSEPSFTSRPSASTNSTSALFSMRKPSEPTSTIACKLDDATESDCVSPMTFSGLREGPHTLKVSFTDLAGNRSVTVARWFVDLTPPVLRDLAPGAVVRSRQQTTYRLSIPIDSADVRQAEWSLFVVKPSDSAPNIPSQTLPFATPLVIRTTARVRWLRVQDAAGNWSSWVAG